MWLGSLYLSRVEHISTADLSVLALSSIVVDAIIDKCFTFIYLRNVTLVDHIAATCQSDIGILVTASYDLPS